MKPWPARPSLVAFGHCFSSSIASLLHRVATINVVYDIAFSLVFHAAHCFILVVVLTCSCFVCLFWLYEFAQVQDWRLGGPHKNEVLLATTYAGMGPSYLVVRRRSGWVRRRIPREVNHEKKSRNALTESLFKTIEHARGLLGSILVHFFIKCFLKCH